MEKNRIHPIGSGKNIRMSYQRQKEVLPMPNLIEVQKAESPSVCMIKRMTGKSRSRGSSWEICP